MHWKRLLSAALMVSMSLQPATTVLAATEANVIRGGISALSNQIGKNRWIAGEAESYSTPSNALSTPSDADKATASNALLKEAFSIRTVSGYGQIEIQWDEVAEATGYTVSRSASADGTYQTLADVTADKRTYIDAAGTGKKWFYKVTATTPDGKEESIAAESDYTSIKALWENAVIHKAFSGEEQRFNGTRAVNISEEDGGAAKALQDMEKGTVIMKVKLSEANSPVGTLLGLKENEAEVPSPSILAGNSLAGTKTAAILAKETGLRYSFHHTRANSSRKLPLGQWTTIVFTNGASSDSKVLRLYVDGNDAGSFTGSGNAGFFSTTGVDTDNASVTIGGLIGPDGTVSSGFKGEIAYVTVTNELLTDQEAQEISQGAAESDILHAFSLDDPSNSWVITGGRNAMGNYKDIGEVRNYAGLFEEVIRWDKNENKRNGLQRFVTNTARTGLTAEKLVEDYDALIGSYSPKGVAVMLEADDLASEPAEVAASMAKLIEKNSEMINPAYTVIQIPVPSLDEEENKKIGELSAAIEEMVLNLDYLTGKRVVIVDHYSQMKSMDVSKLLNEEGFLNAKGHLEVANQLLAATIGVGSKVTEADQNNQPVKGPEYSHQQPVLQIGKNSIAIQVPAHTSGWTYDLDIEGTIIRGTMKESAVIEKLPEGKSFILTIVSKDQTLRLPVMAGIIAEAETAHVWDDMPELTSAQEELQTRLSGGEPLKWLFIGDRITQGAADTVGHDSTSQLFEKYVRDELGRTGDVVINTGVAGATTQNFLDNQEERYTRYADADVVVIMFGTDDAKDQVVGTGSYRQNLENIIDEIRKNGAIPVLRTPNKLMTSSGNLSANLPRYAAIIREVAEEKEIILADHYDLWEKNLYAQSYLNRSGYWQNGEIYPNAAGQLMMAQDLIQAMGLDTKESQLCGLSYPVKTTLTSQGIIPPVNSTKTSIRVNTDYLRKQAGQGTFGSITVTAVSDGMTYTKTVRRDSQNEIPYVELTNLPTGKNYTLTVEADLVNAPKTIRFQTRKIILDGTVNDFIPSDVEGLIYQREEMTMDGTKDTVVDLSSEVSIFQALTEGTLSFRFRVANPEQSSDAGLQTLFSISDNREDARYAAFYIQPNTGVIGLEMKQPGKNNVNASSGKINMKNTDWHTAAFVADKATETLKVYVDGTEVISVAASYFLDIANSNTVRLGDVSRSRGDHMWAFKGDINQFQVYDRPLTLEEVRSLQEPTILEQGETVLPDTAKKTDPVDLFYGGYDNSSHYRIPALLTTESGTVIAAIDQRKSGPGDQGDIATVLRRSTDDGKTWGGVQKLIDLPVGRDRHSFTIDAAMLQDKVTGRVFLLVDMFPESTGLMTGSPISIPTSGYKEVGGERYLILTNKSDNSKTYTLRKDGKVYLENDDGSSAETDYTVPEQHTGEIYKNGAPAGNIYLYSGDNAGELSVLKTSYLWMVSSDDDGATWSNPVCLNGQVKKDWMVFLGTGPGVGIQVEQGEHKGRLIFPVYHTNQNGLGGSQSSAVIYSDDHGETWEIGESPNDGRDGMSAETMNNGGKILTEAQVVEVGNNGRLKLFCRNQGGSVMVATSDDGGETWHDQVVADRALYDSYCQLSIVPYPEQVDGKPAYVFSNPASSGRNNGTVRIGLYDEDSDTFDWKYNQLIHEGKYQYSCIAILSSGEIGVFYEGDQPNMRFTSMTLDWITAPRFNPLSGPEITDVEMERSDSGLLFTVTFNRPMMKIGTPVLQLKADGVPVEAAYVSGSAEQQYQFFYTPTGTEKELVVVNVSGGSSSYIGDLHNELPKDVAFRFSMTEEEKELDQIKQELDNILNDSNATAQEKQEAVTKAAAELQRLDFDSTGVSQADMENIAYIENAYIWNNPNVLAPVLKSYYVQASIRGAALSVPSGSTIRSRVAVEIDEASLPLQLPDGLDSNAITAMEVRMDLDQSGSVTENIQPLVPFELTFELPPGIRPENLVVYHYHDGQILSLPVSVSDNRATVIIKGLSTFLIANERPKNWKPSESDSDSSSATLKLMSITGRWIKDDQGWWFKMANGSYPKDDWVYIEGFWYRFDPNGYMRTGWFQDKDLKWYYLKESGAMASEEWVLDQDKWYYLNSDGVMSASQWLLYKGLWYYLLQNGQMAVNTVIDGQYYVGEDGVWTDRT